MKAIIVLLVAAMALVGAAAAWDTTESLSYQYTKTVDVQAGIIPYFITGPTPQTPTSGTPTQSGAYSTSKSSDGGASNTILVQNAITALSAPITGTGLQDSSDTHNTLIQGGYGKIITNADDPESTGVKNSGTATAYTELDLSGRFSDGASATFVQNAVVGAPSHFGSPNDISMGQSTLTPSIATHNGATVIEPVLGGSTKADFTELQDGSPVRYSGLTTEIAGFNMAFPGTGSITTLMAGGSTFTAPATFPALNPIGNLAAWP